MFFRKHPTPKHQLPWHPHWARAIGRHIDAATPGGIMEPDSNGRYDEPEIKSVRYFPALTDRIADFVRRIAK